MGDAPMAIFHHAENMTNVQLGGAVHEGMIRKRGSEIHRQAADAQENYWTGYSFENMTHRKLRFLTRGNRQDLG